MNVPVCEASTRANTVAPNGAPTGWVDTIRPWDTENTCPDVAVNVAVAVLDGGEKHRSSRMFNDTGPLKLRLAKVSGRHGPGGNPLTVIVSESEMVTWNCPPEVIEIVSLQEAAPTALAELPPSEAVALASARTVPNVISAENWADAEGDAGGESMVPVEVAVRV